MDVADAPASDGAMIALLPITDDWCRIDFPHMTLVYAGLVDELKQTDFNALAKDASDLALLSRPLTIRVIGVEVFGDTEKVNVLRLQPVPELWAMRRVVEKWNASQFPFKPHATIGPAVDFPQNVPPALAFDRVCVGWGDEKLVFRMNNRY